MIKEIATALFIIIAGGLITFVAGLAGKKIAAWFRRIKESQLTLDRLREKNIAHYEEDKVSFEQLNRKLDEIMIGTKKKFESIDIKLANQYTNRELDSKLNERDIKIDGVHERLEAVEHNIVGRLDHLIDQINRIPKQ